jgi:hypothetical protein
VSAFNTSFPGFVLKGSSHILSFKGINGLAYLPDPFFNLWYAWSRKLYEILKQNQDKAPSLYKIRQWLQSKDDYTLLKPIRRIFKTARVIVSEPFEQFEIDVMDLSSIWALSWFCFKISYNFRDHAYHKLKKGSGRYARPFIPLNERICDRCNNQWVDGTFFQSLHTFFRGKNTLIWSDQRV